MLDEAGAARTPRRHAGPHPRPDRDADHGRQGTRQCGGAPRAQARGIERVEILGKMNGAVGNFNAHVAALPQVDWPAFSAAFVESLGSVESHTTQIEPHDWIAEYCHAVMRANTVLLDFARDMWSYISFGYFKQRLIEGEVGSSTMPHKVNPIDFENAEGNLGLRMRCWGFFADKLPISRMQRDLTDSTVLRNLGVAIGHCVLAYQIARDRAGKLELDERGLARIWTAPGRCWAKRCKPSCARMAFPMATIS
jgi:adenylosuccinate lyase